MDQGQASSNPNNSGNVPLSQHYLAEIKYPIIPNFIEIDKIFNVLHKIRLTSKPLHYKWQTLNKPKHGEIYLEQKYPVTRDPVSGDQFSIVDDGYLWSSIPKPELQEYQGQHIEVFKWVEGFSPGDKYFTMTKTEYRLKTPNNILFLIHYLEIKNPIVSIRNALPATKISPIYLQQQFFQQLKQQMAQLISMRRSPSPNLITTTPNQPPNNNKASQKTTNNQNRSNKQAEVPVSSAPAAPTIESSIDIFDSFSNFEAAFYRLNIIRPLLRRLFELPPISSTSNSLKSEIEIDLIEAIKKKIFTIQNRLEISQKNHQEKLKNFKKEQEKFWVLFNDILKTDPSNGIGSDLLNQIINEGNPQNDSIIYTSL